MSSINFLGRYFRQYEIITILKARKKLFIIYTIHDIYLLHMISCTINIIIINIMTRTFILDFKLTYS